MNTKEKLIDAIAQGKLYELESMLDENGEFEIQNDKLEDIKVGKSAFIEWWKKKWEESGWAEVPEPQMKVSIDTCAGCQKGCVVYLLEYGNFPYERNRETGQRLLRGLMLKEQGDKITSILGCSMFEHLGNPFGYEVVQNRVSELMQEAHYNYLTAFIIANFEIYGKHTITIDYDFLMLCNSIDNEMENEK